VSGDFNIAADASINMTAGAAGAVGSGAYTLAMLVRPTTGNNNSGLLWCDSAGSHQRSFFEDALNLFGLNDFSSGFPSLTQGNWFVIAQSKAAGSNLYRFHIWAYASDGSGTMSHGTESGGASQGDGSTIDAIRIGIAEDRGNSLIAAVGLWTSALSDGQLDTLKSASLASWADLSPAELISLENWNGSTGATAVVGTSSQSSITGSVGVGANPPGFSFALTAAAALSGPQVIPPHLLLQLAARNAAMWQNTSTPVQYDQPATDDTGLTDTVAYAQNPTISDDTGLTDTSLVEAAKTATATDTAGLTDALALNYAPAITDSTGLTDNLTQARSNLVTDPTGLTDTVTATSGRAITSTDLAGLTDTLTTQLAAALTIADSTGLTDTLASTWAGQRTLTDDTGLTDTNNRTLTDTSVQPPRAGLDNSTFTSSTEAATTSTSMDGTTSLTRQPS